jgi:hypothetical protein
LYFSTVTITSLRVCATDEGDIMLDRWLLSSTAGGNPEYSVSRAAAKSTGLAWLSG